MDTIGWLLDSDPAIRWQAMRDLADTSPAEIATERAKVSREGVGAEISLPGTRRLLAQGSFTCVVADSFTLLLLRATGADRAEPGVESAVARLESNLRWNNADCWELRAAECGGNLFFEGEVEPCINGGVLALGAYFGRPTESLARRLVGEQLEDGGWNCEAPKSVRSSFHTTICVLEGLLEYERAVGSAPEIATARRRGEEYLLERGLFGGVPRAKSQIRRFWSSRFRPATITTFSGLWTTSGTLAASPMRACAMPWVSSKTKSRAMDDGLLIAPMTRLSHFLSAKRSESLAVGIHSGRCVCSAGMSDQGFRRRALDRPISQISPH